MRTLPLIIAVLALLCLASDAATLRGAYDAAGPGDGYDKLVILEPGVVYTGGLLIGPLLVPETGDLMGEPGRDVCIRGGGAVLDLQGGQICISYCDNRLDIENCVITGGNVRFRGSDYEGCGHPYGSVRYVTFWRPHDYGVRLQGAGEGIEVYRNIVVDAVDTGPDWIFGNGYPADFIPTGRNFAGSAFPGLYGVPSVQENWSYHTDPHVNDLPRHHFVFL
jgi:hypothetical protein